MPSANARAPAPNGGRKILKPATPCFTAPVSSGRAPATPRAKLMPQGSPCACALRSSQRHSRQRGAPRSRPLPRATAGFRGRDAGRICDAARKRSRRTCCGSLRSLRFREALLCAIAGRCHAPIHHSQRLPAASSPRDHSEAKSGGSRNPCHLPQSAPAALHAHGKLSRCRHLHSGHIPSFWPCDLSWRRAPQAADRRRRPSRRLGRVRS
mmetsp:Transcript_34370/g.81050  ORF Transcript_34370/g.81050 Transcript_34370/m.81050 type:complete len:210 (+) Transcript_34370:2972-3601(+)